MAVAAVIGWWLFRGQAEERTSAPWDVSAGERLVPPQVPSGVKVAGGAPDSASALEKESSLPAMEKLKTLLVRRLYDGDVIPRIELGSTPAKGGATGDLIADGKGQVQIPAECLEGLVPKDPRWRAVRQSAEELQTVATLWVYDTVTIRVEVDFQPRGVEGPLDCVTVQAVLPVPDHAGVVPLTGPWLRAHGVRTESIGGGPVEGLPGAFTLEAPRLPQVTVIAGLQGWKPASATLDVPLSVPELSVRLSLTPGLAIKGTVRDEVGRPLANATIEAFVVRWFPWDIERRIPSDMARKFSPVGGVGLATTRDGKLRVRVHEIAKTDAEGRFTVYTKSEGRIGLYVYERGRSGARIDLGELQENFSGVELVAGLTPEDRFVTLMDGGMALKDSEVACLDMTDPLEPSVAMPTDALGRVPRDWFQEGHLYHLLRPHFVGNRGFFRFKGQEAIDLALLPRDDWKDL